MTSKKSGERISAIPQMAVNIPNAVCLKWFSLRTLIMLLITPHLIEVGYTDNVNRMIRDLIGPKKKQMMIRPIF